MEGKAVNFTKPTIIDGFSLDAERKYQNDYSQLKYLKVPKNFNIDLKKGEFKEKTNFYKMERIHQMSQFIMNNQQKVIKNGRVNADFVCFRGALKNLLVAAYDKTQSWTVQAVKIKGTIYFVLFVEYEEQAPSTQQNPSMIGIGFKFERYLLSDHPEMQPKGSSETINENEEFCVMMTTSIDDINILFGMESDGVISDKVVKSVDDLKKCEQVEIKTYKGTRFEYDVGFKLDRAFQWWCQTYIASIDKVYTGFRNHTAIVTKIEAVCMKTLEKEAERKKYWHKNECLKFLKGFLLKIKEDMKNLDDPQTIFCYSWNPKVGNITFKTMNGPNDFFPDNYVAFINNLHN